MVSIFSNNSLQDECLIVESVRGAPKYLEGREVVEKPRMRAILRWVTMGVLKKKI